MSLIAAKQPAVCQRSVCSGLYAGMQSRSFYFNKAFDDFRAFFFWDSLSLAGPQWCPFRDRGEGRAW